MSRLSKEGSEQALRRRLKQIMLLPGNSVCAECRGPSATWASTNLGIFICIRCSGLHRQLGVHISTVKSCTMDRWESEQVDFMESTGNEKAAQLWEARLPSSFRRPQGSDGAAAMLQFLRDKYERRLFRQGSPSAASTQVTLSSTTLNTLAATATQPPALPKQRKKHRRTHSTAEGTTSGTESHASPLGADFARSSTTTTNPSVCRTDTTTATSSAIPSPAEDRDAFTDSAEPEVTPFDFRGFVFAKEPIEKSGTPQSGLPPTIDPTEATHRYHHMHSASQSESPPLMNALPLHIVEPVLVTSTSKGRPPAEKAFVAHPPATSSAFSFIRRRPLPPPPPPPPMEEDVATTPIPGAPVYNTASRPGLMMSPPPDTVVPSGGDGAQQSQDSADADELDAHYRRMEEQLARLTAQI